MCTTNSNFFFFCSKSSEISIVISIGGTVRDFNIRRFAWERDRCEPMRSLSFTNAFTQDLRNEQVYIGGNDRIKYWVSHYWRFTDPPFPSKTTILGLLQIRIQHLQKLRENKTTKLGLWKIRILHLRKRREKSFSSAKMFLVLKLCRFKVVNYTPYGLGRFLRSKFLSFIIGDRALIFGHSR